MTNKTAKSRTRTNTCKYIESVTLYTHVFRHQYWKNKVVLKHHIIIQKHWDISKNSTTVLLWICWTTSRA